MSTSIQKSNTPKNKDNNNLPIAELYPELNQSEREEAEYFLNRFLEVMHSIFEENQAKSRD